MEKLKVRILKGNGTPLVSKKLNRNEKCQCGSGKKQKQCCGDVTKYYHSKNKQKKL